MPQHPLIRLMLAQAHGRDEIPHRPVPPAHLCDRRWRFVCPCGSLFHQQGDAVWRDQAWAPPRQQCLLCHEWVSGHVIEA
jgi:hypothetical protein